jgi:aminopeptidase N
MKRLIPVLITFLSALTVRAGQYTHADTLRGSNGSGRSWWNVTRYQLDVKFDTAAQSITGSNQMFFRVTAQPGDSMQVDLQQPVVLDSVYVMSSTRTSGGVRKAAIVQEGNVWWVKYPFNTLKQDSLYSLLVFYHGVPRKAVNPPWDGGFSWKTDSLGRQWMAVSCQGLGASVWWPCKDAQWDEPEDGMINSFTVPSALTCISNGRKVGNTQTDGNTTTTWMVRNPINNYDVTFYIGHYATWHDTLNGEKGVLDLDYAVLDYNQDRARAHFGVVKTMLRAFEYWFGPYPFYEDGYKLVESPYLGMEHQSGIAYGNKFRMGYKGTDRSMTGHGLKWDYIIIHESGHEWFGNNVTAKDMADNWIHEGITCYSEVLFTEYIAGKDNAAAYSRGLWTHIRNDQPVVAPYGVNDEGTGDIYEKGEAVMHMVRVLTNNDDKFRKMLRGLGNEFYHKTVTTAEVEQYIAKTTGLELGAFFNQYLREKDIPELEYYIKNKELNFRFSNVVPGFSLPLTATNGDKKATIKVTGDWAKVAWDGGYDVNFSKDFLIKLKK